MANQGQYNIIKQGVEVWNQWREEHLDIQPDLSRANLGEVDLTGANLSGTDLSNTNLWRANLSGANLSGVNLSGVHLTGANLRQANLVGADLSQATLIDANLSGVNLSGADLSGVYLSGADLSGANLSRVDLTGANLRQANLVGADLSQATLIDANLSGAILREANLNQAKLNGAILSGANLQRAKLGGAELKGADLQEAELSSTIMPEFEKEQLRGRGAIGLDEIGMTVVESKSYETEEKPEEKISRLQANRKLKVAESTSMLHIRIREEPLTAQNLTIIISTLTELYTKCWLIVQSRFPELINYVQTHDIRFTKEANLTIGKLAHSSPTLVELILNPTMLAAAAGGVVTLAGALKIAIDNIGQTSLRFKEKELDIEIRRQEAQQAQQTAARKADLEEQKAQLEIEKQQLEIDRERLEVEKNRIEVALETASKMVDTLRPGIDKETKGMLVQALLPSLLQLGTTEGLEVVSDGEEAPKEDNQA